MDKQTSQQIPPAIKVGRGVNEFCAAIDLCRGSYYNLPPELQPKSVKFGKRRIIIEDPRSYLERIAAAQAQAVTNTRAA